MYLGFPAIDEGNEPPLQLKAFSKVMLNPGESKTVELKLDTRAFSYWSEKAHEWTGGAGRISGDGGGFVGEYSAESEPHDPLVVLSALRVPRAVFVSAGGVDRQTHDETRVAGLGFHVDGSAEFLCHDAVHDLEAESRARCPAAWW